MEEKIHIINFERYISLQWKWGLLEAGLNTSAVGMFSCTLFFGLGTEEWWHLQGHHRVGGVKGKQSKAESGPGLQGSPWRCGGSYFSKSPVCQPFLPYSLNCAYLLSFLRLSIILVMLMLSLCTLWEVIEWV